MIEPQLVLGEKMLERIKKIIGSMFETSQPVQKPVVVEEEKPEPLATGRRAELYQQIKEKFGLTRISDGLVEVCEMLGTEPCTGLVLEQFPTFNEGDLAAIIERGIKLEKWDGCHHVRINLTYLTGQTKKKYARLPRQAESSLSDYPNWAIAPMNSGQEDGLIMNVNSTDIRITNSTTGRVILERSKYSEPVKIYDRGDRLEVYSGRYGLSISKKDAQIERFD